MSIKEKISWDTKFIRARFMDPMGIFGITKFMKQGGQIEEAINKFSEHFLGLDMWYGNVALNEGLAEIIDLLAGEGTPDAYSNANAYVGVGNSSTAEQATDTGLIGASKAYVAMDGVYPTRTNQMCDWRGTFGDGVAEFAWEEYTLVNASSDTGENLMRKTASKGTKASGESWTLSIQITFS